MARSAALLVVLASCVESTPETLPRSQVAPVTSPARLPSWRGARALPMLPDDAPKSAAYLAAVEAWRTATTAWSLGDATRSAESFLRAAAHLSGGEPEPIARTFAAGRCLAYESAARAYTEAKRFDEAQAELTAASLADPACRHSIAGALARLTEERTKDPTTARTKAAFSPQWRPL